MLRTDLIHNAMQIAMATRRRPGTPRLVVSAGEEPDQGQGTLRILIVDDDADMRGSLEDLLSLEGDPEIWTAGDGASAVRAARIAPPDIVLLDIRLGRENGIDLIPVLRECSPDMVCIVMTAYRNSDYFTLAMDCGANEFLYKPLNPDRLKRLIDQARR
jgi:NtrC-family two-component system response regulator AlgB